MFKAIQCRIRIMRTLWSKLFIVLQLEGEKVEAVTDFFLRGSKITVDGNCSHESKRCLLLGRKAMINLDSILLIKIRDVTLQTKVHAVKAMVSLVLMYGRESWAIKKAER